MQEKELFALCFLVNKNLSVAKIDSQLFKFKIQNMKTRIIKSQFDFNM